MKPSDTLLASFFKRNGYFRLPDSERRKRDGSDYKKGYEIRLVAKDASELEQIRELLVAAGFKTAKAFPKGNQWIQPIYGREAVERFCRICKLEDPF
ncbi:MAG TPA: hypothetical protein PKD24_14725 [Pyrinomonadaceae bacterium]|nr:hypothetical protein [Pyrinomonadaceae bacterium]HMP66628.1 hypothetical protein [Pyrinomonadaceae bacterium]